VAHDTDEPNGASRIGRRKYLTASILAAAGLAGCSGGGDESTATGAETPTSSEMEQSATRSPESVTRSFYNTLYGDDDIEGTNALYHPESPAPEIQASNFEPFGGLETIETTIESVTVVSNDDGRATVHATIDYTFPNRTTTNTDYMYLRQSGEEWRVNRWFPEGLRRRFAKNTVVEFYDTLYNQNDLEAANAMYHPDDGGPLEASSFESYGGLENIETTVTSTEVVAEGDGAAEVHADVEYSTPNGTNTATDYVFLKLYQGNWRIDSWVPEAVRESESENG